MRSWTEREFEQLSWHDCHVHGFAIREGEHGAGQLVLDLDFIVEWRKSVAGAAFRFLVAPATLTFNDVTDLSLNVDYVGIAMGPFSIAGINRKVKTYPNGFTTYEWDIPINFPQGSVSRRRRDLVGTVSRRASYSLDDV